MAGGRGQPAGLRSAPSIAASFLVRQYGHRLACYSSHVGLGVMSPEAAGTSMSLNRDFDSQRRDRCHSNLFPIIFNGKALLVRQRWSHYDCALVHCTSLESSAWSSKAVSSFVQTHPVFGDQWPSTPNTCRIVARNSIATKSNSKNRSDCITAPRVQQQRLSY